MSCPEELELFLLHEGGDELSEERAKEVADHLSSCPDCQAKVAELEAFGQALAAPEPMAENDKSAFVAEVIKKVEAQEPKKTAAPSSSKFWTVGLPLIAAAACAVVAIIALPTLLLTAGVEEEVAFQSAAEPAPAPAAAPVRSMDEAEGEMQTTAAESTAAPLDSTAIRGGGAGSGGRARGGPGSPSANSASVRRRPASKSAARPSVKRRRSSPPSPPAERARREAPVGLGAVAADEEEADDRLARRPRRQASGAQLAVKSSPGGFATATPSPSQGWINPAKVAQNRAGSIRPAARPTAIDSNGRFATTYRPGRGHLARFERTMLTGQVPQPAIELVAEQGSGHGPVITPPTETALALDVRPGMSALPVEGGPVHLALTLRSTTQEPASRPKVAVHLVMDTSGSMSGQAIQHARQAALQLVSLLQDTDRFSLISYSTGASVVVSEGPVGRRRAEILRQINSLDARGGTNLEAGLRQGYAQAQASRSHEDAVQLAIILSDGQPNQGNTDPWALSEMSAAAFQSGVETTTIGVGDSYEPQVMSTIAEYGAGGYYYLPDASTIEQVLRTELDVRTQPVARGVELRVRLGRRGRSARGLRLPPAQRAGGTAGALDRGGHRPPGVAPQRHRPRPAAGPRRRDEVLHPRLRPRRPPHHPAAAASAGGHEPAAASLGGAAIQGPGQPVQPGRRATGVREPRRQHRGGPGHHRRRRAASGLRLPHRPGAGPGLGPIRTGSRQAALATLFERVAMLRAAAEELDDATLRADAERLDNFRTVLTQRTMTNNLMLGSMLQRAGNGFMR